MAVLNGKRVSDDEINPTKHRFIGMFRAPAPPKIPQCYIFLCSCGTSLRSVGEEHSHWLRGCFDQAQYVDIENF